MVGFKRKKNSTTLTLALAIKAATLTLLNDRLSSNKGNREHGVKNVTAGREGFVLQNINLKCLLVNLRASRFSAWSGTRSL